jgi:hypothetical protein
MLKNTKIAVTIIFILLSSFSGCTLLSFFEETEFLLHSSNIADAEGFTSLFLSFNTTDKITLKLLGPNRNILFLEEYYKGAHEEAISLGNYRITPSSGTYYLKVYDINEKKIFENELFFTDQNLTITKIIEKWWFYDEMYFLVGLTITLKNTGGLPIYPHSATVKVDNKESSGFILPSVILSRQSKNVDCFVYLDDVSADNSLLELSVKSYDGKMLADTTQAGHFSKNIPNLEYSWKYNGHYNTLVLPDIDFLYDYYSSLKRLVIEDYTAYLFDVYDDQYIGLVAERLLALTDASDDVDVINFAASFIQSLQYAEDDENDSTCEYPRYPVEMLKDTQGDCEDKAMLTSALLDNMAFNVSLIRLPNHMAVGVHLDENLSEYEYYADGYYFLETTRNRWDLGRVPAEYRGIANVTVYPLSSRPIIVHNWKNATRISSSDGSDYVQIKILIENLGRKTAKNFEVKGAFFNQNDASFNTDAVLVSSLVAGDKKVVELKINVPQSFSSTLKTQIYMDNKMVHEKESSSVFP